MMLMLQRLAAATLRLVPERLASALVVSEATLEPQLTALLVEDFDTYDRRFSEPGFWAIVAHRLGQRVERAPSPFVRRALGLPQRALATAVDWLWGIRIAPEAALGRRVRIWQSGGMLLAARSIGNDVQIRHDTTLGPLRSTDAGPEALPVIEDRVDIGSGVAILGGVVIGHDAVIGHNSVVLQNIPPGATVLGVPVKAVA